MESADGLWMPCLYIACLNFFLLAAVLVVSDKSTATTGPFFLVGQCSWWIFQCGGRPAATWSACLFYDGPICWWHFLIRPSMEYFSTVGVRLPLTKNNTCLSKLQKSTGPRALRGADSVGAFPLCPVLWFHQLQDTILHAICLHLFFPNFAGRQPNVPTW